MTRRVRCGYMEAFCWLTALWEKLVWHMGWEVGLGALECAFGVGTGNNIRIARPRDDVSSDF